MKYLMRILNAVVQKCWKKLVKPTVGLGQTAWPKNQADQLKYGIRFDYAGKEEKDNVVYHKYECQPNAGKVPSSIQKWLRANGGTHAVIATVSIKENGTEEDVLDTIEQAFEEA